MNKKQKRILAFAVAMAILMLLIPPVHYVGGTSWSARHGAAGYMFILDVGGHDVDISVDLLLVQWIGVFLIATPLWFFAKNQASDQRPFTEPEDQVSPSSIKATNSWFKRQITLKTARWVIFVCVAIWLALYIDNRFVEEQGQVERLESQVALLEARVDDFGKRVGTLESRMQTASRPPGKGRTPPSAEEVFGPHPKEQQSGTQSKSAKQPVDTDTVKQNWRKLRAGMQKDDVKQILGDPLKIEKRFTVEYWYYTDDGILGPHAAFTDDKLAAWVEP